MIVVFVPICNTSSEATFPCEVQATYLDTINAWPTVVQRTRPTNVAIIHKQCQETIQRSALAFADPKMNGPISLPPVTAARFATNIYYYL